MEDGEPLNSKDIAFIFATFAIIWIVWFCIIYFGMQFIFN